MRGMRPRGIALVFVMAFGCNAATEGTGATDGGSGETETDSGTDSGTESGTSTSGTATGGTTAGSASASGTGATDGSSSGASATDSGSAGTDDTSTGGTGSSSGVSSSTGSGGSSGSGTTGSTSGTGSSTGGSTTTGGSTGGTGGGVDYGECVNDMCPAGQSCEFEDGSFGFNDGSGTWCAEACGNAGDCPPPPTGDAMPTCMGGKCALDCGGLFNTNCPDGMQCLDQFLGPSICVFPD